jgi:hypothetical protein
MPAKPVQFKESLMRRIVHAAHHEGLQISYVEVLPDRTVRLHTVPQPPLDLLKEINVDDIMCAQQGEAAA